MTIHNGYKMRPYMSILYTKYTYKIDNFVHIFVILVYKIGTKCGTVSCIKKLYKMVQFCM